ncbi:Haloacid dehalogenase-like hydrolase domain-containing protein 3 [Clydaea vesicula]|uniref:Haloacid dehalogenase-like hydrolase domain-containing protein 3 n=1 Tax=Clydaea vesicula TaxID=447962 RepID=A0AAD5Y0Q3_9FUNG|nr:Haloacid dehalogenase-like hydrolase domain-containing protein 3 [Clydaea vesicula]
MTKKFHFIRALTFDCFGTLFRPKHAIGKLYELKAKEHNIVIDPIALNNSFLQTYKKYDTLKPNFGTEMNGEKVEEEAKITKLWWKNVVFETFLNCQEFDIKVLELLFEDLYESFKKGDFYEVFEETPQVLKTLKSKGFLLGIISNMDHRIVYSSSISFVKPQSQIFEEAFRKTRLFQPTVDRNSVLHVGDDKLKDYDGATKFGNKALLLKRYNSIDNSTDDSNTISNLNEIFKHLVK